jgi:putative membrane protein
MALSKRKIRKIKSSLYQKFVEKQLPLGDQLAAARSILANERTFLSYQRTALTLAVAGFSFIKFFVDPFFHFVGWIFIPSAVITVTLGVMRYVKMRDLIRNLEMEKFEQDQQKKGDNVLPTTNGASLQQ